MKTPFKPRPGARHTKNPSPVSKEMPANLASIIDLDKQLIQLLLKRHSLLQKVKKGGRIDPGDERYLREAWQRAAAKVSRDPDLSSHFFTLLQQLVFLPKPEDKCVNQSVNANGFILAPPTRPVDIELQAPLSDWATFAWLYLAAAAGQKLQLEPCLQNDPQIDFIQTLVQLGGAVTRKDNAIITRPSMPLGTPDRVVNAGSSEFGFYLVLAHYLGRASRVKFTGAANLKMADFSEVRHFLSQMQARLVTLVPRNEGLPARLEAAGILPPGVCLPATVPAQFAEALILCAVTYPAPFAVDLTNLSAKESVLAHVLPVLNESGAVYALNRNTVSIEPGPLAIPETPNLPLEPELAAFMLGFTAPLTGKARLQGLWPDWPELEDIWSIGQAVGWQKEDTLISVQSSVPILQIKVGELSPLPEWGVGFVTALAACAALKGGKAQLPETWHANSNVGDLLRMAALHMDESGEVKKLESSRGGCWNAPSPAWTMALALAACARSEKQGWILGNPAEIMDLWPLFWQFYNNLPDPDFRKKEEPQPKMHRRIKTAIQATLPERKEE